MKLGSFISLRVLSYALWYRYDGYQDPIECEWSCNWTLDLCTLWLSAVSYQEAIIRILKIDPDLRQCRDVFFALYNGHPLYKDDSPVARTKRPSHAYKPTIPKAVWRKNKTFELHAQNMQAIHDAAGVHYRPYRSVVISNPTLRKDLENDDKRYRSSAYAIPNPAPCFQQPPCLVTRDQYAGKPITKVTTLPIDESREKQYQMKNVSMYGRTILQDLKDEKPAKPVELTLAPCFQGKIKLG